MLDLWGLFHENLFQGGQTTAEVELVPVIKQSLGIRIVFPGRTDRWGEGPRASFWRPRAVEIDGERAIVHRAWLLQKKGDRTCRFGEIFNSMTWLAVRAAK
jgi:hypothetical protein